MTENVNLKLSLFFKEASLFAATLVLGVLGSIRLQGFFQEVIKNEIHVSLINFLIYILLGTIFILFVSKHQKISHYFFPIFFALIIFSGSEILFSAFLSKQLVFFAALLITLLRFFYPRIWTHNLAIILSIAGVGIILGFEIEPKSVLILLVILSVYDYIAVYKTKHMVKMAKAMIDRHVLLGLIIPESGTDFKKHIREAKPHQGFVFLGGGDIALPLIFAVSMARQSLSSGFIIIIFALLGLFANHYFFTHQKEPKPMPALPLISAMVIVGYILIKFIF